jgi:hypothetical protein
VTQTPFASQGECARDECDGNYSDVQQRVQNHLRDYVRPTRDERETKAKPWCSKEAAPPAPLHSKKTPASARCEGDPPQLLMAQYAFQFSST